MRKIILFVLLLLCVSSFSQAQLKPDLGSAAAYTVLAGTSVQNAGNTKIDGNLGIWPGNSMSGFPPGTVYGATELATPASQNAKADLDAAYAQALNQAASSNLSGQNLGGRTLLPGVYKFDQAADLTGTLTLSNNGDPNAVFIFQVGTNLNVAGGAEVKLLESASPQIHHVFWQVGGQVSLGTGALLRGSVLATQDISIGSGSVIQGRLLSRQGGVRLSNNTITAPTDLAVSQTKTDGSIATGVYAVGETVTFTITARNEGPLHGRNVRVKYELHSGFTFVSASVPGGVTFDQSALQWTIASLPSGSSVTLELVARINGTQTEYIANTVTIAQDAIDEKRENNTHTISLCVAPAPPGQISGPASVCINQEYTYSITPSPGGGFYTWRVPEGWSIVSGEFTNSIQVLITPQALSGEISVMVGNTCADSAPSEKAVAVNNAAAATPGPIQHDSSGLNPCRSQVTTTYSIDPVDQATAYEWTVPSDWKIISGQGTTTITVEIGTASGDITVTALNSCTPPNPPSTLAVVAAVSPPTAAQGITGNQAPCIGQEVTYSLSGADGATSFRWTLPADWTFKAGSNSSSRSVVVIAGSTAGEIKAAGINGCGETAEVSLAVNPDSPLLLPAGPISGPVSPCVNTTGHTYQVEPVAGATSYLWTAPGLQITEGQNTNVIKVAVGPNASATTITVVALNSCGPSPERTLSITPISISATPQPITGKQAVCINEADLVYAVPEVAGATTYTWSLPEGWQLVSGAGTASITVQAGTAGGNIRVSAGNSCGQSSERILAVQLSTAPPAAPGAISGPTSICAGSANVTYSIAAVTGAFSYTWAVPADWTITSGQGSTSLVVKVGQMAGEIRVQAVNGCGQSTESILAVTPTISVPPAPGPVQASDTDFCASQEQVSYSITPMPGVSNYTWTVPAGWQITSGQGSPDITVKPSVNAGDVSVAAVNSCGPGPASRLSVRPRLVPEAPQAITGQTIPCAGSTDNVYTVREVPGATSYEWTVPSDWSISSGQGTTSIQVVVGRETGNITVRAVNDCGSSAASQLAVKPSSSVPGIPGTIMGSSNVCGTNQNVTYTYSVTASDDATVYFWTVPEGWEILDGQGTINISVRVGPESGIISVMAENGCGRSGASSWAIVPTMGTPLSVGPISGPGETCAGQQALQYSVAPVDGADTYTWQVPAGWTITSGQGTNQVSLQAGSNSGTVSVSASNACTTSPVSSLDIRVNPAPPAPGPIQDLSSVCEGLRYAVEPQAGVTDYTWTLPAGWTITEGAGTASIKVKAGGSERGLISVVAHAGDCSSAAATLEADPARAEDIVIPNVFSPNGDGVNDTWQILNIGNFPDNEVVILNRWGNEVYSRRSYRNDWDGGGLSAGTYYYVLKVKGCGGSYRSFKGYVMIMR